MDRSVWGNAPLGRKPTLEADEAIFKADFLENVASDEPKGCWSIQTPSPDFALIRNHLWRGFSAFAVAGMANHGYCYVGNALKNNDFTFM